MKNRYILLYILTFSSLHSSGQLLNVSGKIIDEQLEELPGVNIYDLDTTLLTTTDLDGTFELENAPTNLLLGFLGYEWLDISLTNDCANPEIIMLFDVNYHYKSHRKIDRLRKKRFNNRTNIQEQAYEQGTFQNKEPCFEYEFIPNKPKLDEIRNWMNDKKSRINKEYKELAIGDTIFVAYGTSWRSDGTDRTSLHHYSGYTDETEFDCLIKGVVLSKDNRGNIKYRVISTDNCDFEAIILNGRSVDIDEVFESNFKYFRVIMASNML